MSLSIPSIKRQEPSKKRITEQLLGWRQLSPEMIEPKERVQDYRTSTPTVASVLESSAGRPCPAVKLFLERVSTIRNKYGF